MSLQDWRGPATAQSGTSAGALSDKHYDLITLHSSLILSLFFFFEVSVCIISASCPIVNRDFFLGEGGEGERESVIGEGF